MWSCFHLYQEGFEFFSKFLINSNDFCNQLSVTSAFYCFLIILGLEDCRRKRKTVAPVRLKACEFLSLAVSLCTHNPLL